MELRLPLLLDGDITGFLRRGGMPPDRCEQRWMLRRPTLLAEGQAAFVAAGADLLCAPTYDLNVLMASRWEIAESAELCGLLMELTAESAEGRVLAAGGISATGQEPEPFGAIPFHDMIDTFAEQALALRDGGAQLLLISGIPTLAEARAAVLGARQARLPLLVSLRPAQGTDPLAALICLQELGITAFGLDCERNTTELAENLRRIAPYAKVPLIARMDARFGDNEKQVLTAQAYANEHILLLQAGAQVVGGGADVSPEHIAALRGVMSTFAATEKPVAKESGLFSSDEGRAYPLGEKCVLSHKIACEVDMARAILDAEDSGCQALLFHIAERKDPYLLSQNAYKAATAACLFAESEELLEEALILHNGRALIDRRSNVRRETLEELAKGYGALILDS